MKGKELMVRERYQMEPVAQADNDNQSFQAAVLDRRRWAAASLQVQSPKLKEWRTFPKFKHNKE